MKDSKEKIKICSNHQHYRTPLIWTFAFPYKEYWCPYCGLTGGMFGTGEDVNQTLVLIKRLKIYEKSTKEYLHAQSCTYAVGIKWRGKTIHPDKLPDKEKKRLHNIRGNGWRYKTQTAKL